MSMFCSAPAFAEDEANTSDSATQDAQQTTVAVRGMDYLEPASTAWEVLRVENLGAKPIFLDVVRHDGEKATQIMKLRPYPQTDEEHAAVDATKDEGVNLAHVVTIALKDGEDKALTPEAVFADYDNHPTFDVTVHAAPRGNQVLFSGTIYPVYAETVVDGAVAGHQLLGIRTTDGTTSMNVGAGNTFYTFADDAAQLESYALAKTDDGLDNAFDKKNQCYTVRYDKTDSQAIDGSILYVDTEGATVRTESVSNITEAGVAVPVEKSFFVGSDYYRALTNLAGTTVQLTPRHATQVVHVIKVNGMDESSYSVTVRYEDEDGALLWSDELDVRGSGYAYTLPDSFSMTSKNANAGRDSSANPVNFYTLDRVEPQAADTQTWTNPLRFDASLNESDFATDENGKRTLTAVYSTSDVEATFKVVEIDGTNGAVLGEVKETITPESGSTYTPAERDINGVKYVPWSGNAQPISYTWNNLLAGDDLLQRVYYVPETYTAGETYSVTVQYLNIADNAILHTETRTVNPNESNFVEIAGPEQFDMDGNTYVRLPGQERAIRHAYLSPARAYTIYYRDVNDVINANTTVTRTQVIETTRTVVTPAAPVSITALPATPAADAGAAAVPDAGVTEGDGTTIINDDDNPLANLAGQDTTTERTIADSENPLSAGEEAAAFNPAVIGVVAGIAGVIALAAVFAFIYLKRRKKNATEGHKA